MTTSTTSIDIMGLQAAYANLHTDQERDYFMQRYHDVISSFGGKTSYDADNRPLLVMRSNVWASGYDVDGTDQTSLGQFSGRVQQFFFSSRRRHTRWNCDWSSDVCSSDLPAPPARGRRGSAPAECAAGRRQWSGHRAGAPAGPCGPPCPRR